jgi:3-hydroxyisobutyrate dehydrogenase/putative dehydrogenase
MKVNFIGVGAIGLPMARQISQAGHDVVGMDLVAATCDRARSEGIHTVGRVAELQPADVTVVMVATPQQLEKLVDDVLENATASSHWVLMSTVGPASARVQGERLRSTGAKVVDAPVTGGVARAKTGQLVIFAAGHSGDIAVVRPVLETMGDVQAAGASLGDGQAIKVVNQHLCSVHLAAAAEALSLAASLGLDPAHVLSMVEKGAAGSWMLSDRGPRMLRGTDVEVTSTVDIFVKDSGLVAQAAQDCAAKVPLLDVARLRFSQASVAGLGKRDDSRVIETWR